MTDAPPDDELLRLMHKTVRVVTEDVENLRFNTAIARLMELANALTPLAQRPRKLVETLVLLLSPFAPHLGEELWQRLGHDDTLAYAPWPGFDPELAYDQMKVYPVQINGKVRHKVTAEADLDAAALLATMRADPKVAGLLDGKTLIKEIAVPGRLVNFVIKT